MNIFFFILITVISNFSQIIFTALESTSTKESMLFDDNGPSNIFFNFDKTPLSAIMNYFAEQRTKSGDPCNIIPNNDLAQVKVSLKTREPINFKKAWDILLTLLDINSFTLVKVNGIYKIVSTKDNAKEALEVYSSATGTPAHELPDSDKVIRYVHFLKNIRADQAGTILGSMLTDKHSVDSNNNIDSIVIKERCSVIKSAMKILDELDQGGLKQSLKIIQLQYASAHDVAKLFNSNILPKDSRGDSIRFWSPNRKETSYFSSNIKIIPDNSRNSLILLGQENAIDRTIAFIEKYMDKELNSTSTIHIVELQYMASEKLATLLTQIIKPPAGIPQESLGLFRAFQDVTIIPESAKAADTQGYGSGNRLIISCAPDDWRIIEKLIKKIDIPQLQVALECMVVDLSESGNITLGNQLRQKNLGNLMGQTVSAQAANLGIVQNSFAGDSPNQLINMPLKDTEASNQGLAVAFGEGSANVWNILKTIVTSSNSEVLSQPFIVVNNKQPCTVDVAETRNTAGDYATGSQGRRDFVQLPANNKVKITPRINHVGQVDMQLQINFTDFTEKSNDSTQPRTTRTLSTRVTIGLGEVLILGGMKQSKIAETVSKIPILGDINIPPFNFLFRSKKQVTTKTNLYIFIRPSIIKPSLSGAIDDYTQLKVDYAKRQIFNFESYSRSKDPFMRFFFKPDNYSSKELIKDAKEKRFNRIDDFTSNRNQPHATYNELELKNFNSDGSK